MTCATCGQALELANVRHAFFWTCCACGVFSIAGANLADWRAQSPEQWESSRLRLRELRYVDRIRRTTGRERLDAEVAERARRWVREWLERSAVEWP